MMIVYVHNNPSYHDTRENEKANERESEKARKQESERIRISLLEKQSLHHEGAKSAQI